MEEPPENVIHGRCGCGKRFRVRHAQPGLTVTCPNCGRTIAITDADVRAAGADERLLPLQSEPAATMEAVLLDDVDLLPAATGSEPGLTGRSVHIHEEALLADALHPRMGRTHPFHASAPPLEPNPAGSDTAGHAGQFLRDVLSSFYFAGSTTSMLAFVGLVLAGSLPWIFGMLLAGLLPWPVSLVAWLGAHIYLGIFATQFLWNTLGRTASGHDDIPLVAPAWDPWDDALKPLLSVAFITALCTLPGLLLWALLPQTEPLRPILAGGALALGSLFWPVAIMSVHLGQTLRFLRPDWLIRCTYAIGPVYLVAWLEALAIGGGLTALLTNDAVLPGGWMVERLAYPLAAAATVLYAGFVLFRTLGLLFRHYRGRFPWKF